MLRALSDGIIFVALIFMWLAAAWVVIDLLFADPAVLVFEDIAIGCAILAPITYMIGWGVQRISPDAR